MYDKETWHTQTNASCVVNTRFSSSNYNSNVCCYYMVCIFLAYIPSQSLWQDTSHYIDAYLYGHSLLTWTSFNMTHNWLMSSDPQNTDQALLQGTSTANMKSVYDEHNTFWWLHWVILHVSSIANILLIQWDSMYGAIIGLLCLCGYSNLTSTDLGNPTKSLCELRANILSM